jgi:AcrR family transcriptional regulator
MNRSQPTGARGIARAAVRAQLAQAAFDLFRRDGFDKVTVNDVAAAAGVSRSTFLRYFQTKEDAVLGRLDGQGQELAEALRARPADEDDWTALRRALDVFIAHNHEDPIAALEETRLILATPALRTGLLDKQAKWQSALAGILTQRVGSSVRSPMAPWVRAAAALDCFIIAIDHWTAADGRLDLADLVDEAFEALPAT